MINIVTKTMMKGAISSIITNYISPPFHPQPMGQNKVRDIMTTDLVTLSPNNTVREATKRLAVGNISAKPPWSTRTTGW